MKEHTRRDDVTPARKRSIKPPRTIKSFDQLMAWLEQVLEDAHRELHTAVIERADELDDFDGTIAAIDDMHNDPSWREKTARDLRAGLKWARGED